MSHGSHRSHIPAQRRPIQLLQETLESRVLLSQVTFNVTNTHDSGTGSLRQAITQANLIAPANSALIQLKIPGSGVHTIKPLSGLPFITAQVDIVGQTDSSGNPLTELDGESAGSFSDGLFLDRNTPGNNVASEITGLVINRFGSTGIDVHDGHAIIFGCRIGTNAAGTSACLTITKGFCSRVREARSAKTPLAARSPC